MLTILFRKNLGEEEEFDIASKHFNVVEYRSDIPKDSLVIPRYSTLPHYQELEYDVNKLGSRLIQSYKQHKWIADFEYYEVLRKYTFETWHMGEIYKAPKDIKYVVKGKTNSRKWRWNTDMFASSREQAIKVGVNLCGDSMIGHQGVIYRRYEPLKKLEEGINGIPFSNEYRFFFLGTKQIAGAYYWAIAENPPTEVPLQAKKFAQYIANIASEYTNFFVLDVAEKEDGGWILVEMNCGTMSGLSMIEPDEFYSSLRNVL